MLDLVLDFVLLFVSITVWLLVWHFDLTKLCQRRYVVQWSPNWNSSWGWMNIRKGYFYRLCDALDKCDDESKDMLKYRVWDRQLGKVRYENGRHRRPEEGNSGHSAKGTGSYPRCISCTGTWWYPRREPICAGCRAGIRTGSGVRNGENLIRLFGMPIGQWRLLGLGCSCTLAGTIRITLKYDYRFQEDQYVLIGDIRCPHYLLIGMKLTPCFDHFSLSLDKELQCCVEAGKNVEEEVFGAIRGWRLFKVREDKSGKIWLSSFVTRYDYKPGLNVCDAYAYGLQNFRHGPSGGFYAFDNIHRILFQEPESYTDVMVGRVQIGSSWLGVAIGSVLMLGGVKEADYGWRAQKVIPETILMTGTTGLESYNFMALRLAERYGLKMVHWSEAKLMQTGLVPFDEEQLKKYERNHD